MADLERNFGAQETAEECSVVVWLSAREDMQRRSSVQACVMNWGGGGML